MNAFDRYRQIIRQEAVLRAARDMCWSEMTAAEQQASPWLCVACGKENASRSQRGCLHCQKELLRQVKLRITQPLHDIRCGRHSGLPACCIAFFPLWKIVRHAIGTKMPKDWGYAPCPICVARNHRVEVRACDCAQRRHGASAAPRDE